jgi:hypothetical protein
MKEGFWDFVTDQLKVEMDGLRNEVRSMFKGEKPYRMEPVEPKEQLYNYEKIAPEVKAYYQNADPVGFAQVEMEMDKLRRRYNA